jgi:hypothetical protein
MMLSISSPKRRADSSGTGVNTIVIRPQRTAERFEYLPQACILRVLKNNLLDRLQRPSGLVGQVVALASAVLPQIGRLRQLVESAILKPGHCRIASARCQRPKRFQAQAAVLRAPKRRDFRYKLDTLAKSSIKFPLYQELALETFHVFPP